MEKEPKQVIVMRKDLGMSRGKIIAQSAHATKAPIFPDMIKITEVNGIVGAKVKEIPLPVALWFTGKWVAIGLRIDSDDELLEIYRQAKAAGLPCDLITDAGRTELGRPTNTAVGIGPWWPEEIDKITGHLPLYK